MTVRVTEMFGAQSFWLIQSTLQHDTPTTIAISGVTGIVTSEMSPSIRTYQWIVPYAFIPQQDHLIPLTNQQFTTYGFDASQPTTSSDDQRIRLARWYGSTYQLITPHNGYLLSGIFFVVVWMGMWWMYYTDLRWYALLTGATCALWGVEWLVLGVLTVEPLITLIVTVGSWQAGRWMFPRLRLSLHIPIWLGAISFYGVYAYATRYWMQGVDITEFNGWGDFWSYIATMRMAMPIPLLIIEYAIYWLGIPGLWSIGYLAVIVRIGMITGLLWALAPWFDADRRRQVGASIIMIGLLAGMAFVFRYTDRNVWMVYDALFAAPLIWLWRTLPRPSWRPFTLISIGFVLVWLDALRPFMLLFTPVLVGIVAWRVWRTAGHTALLYVLVPLIISISWHAYHIVALAQLSWSSHTGFNIARAWIPDVVMRTMSGTLPDMNSRAYLDISNQLITQSITWIVTNPWRAIERAGALIWAMVCVPVEMSRLNDGGVYTVVERTIPWYVYGYRTLMIIGLVRQTVRFMHQLIQRNWSVAWWNAVFVLAIIGLSALTEYGEQARFIAAMAALLWYVDVRYDSRDNHHHPIHEKHDAHV